MGMTSDLDGGVIQLDRVVLPDRVLGLDIGLGGRRARGDDHECVVARTPGC